MYPYDSTDHSTKTVSLKTAEKNDTKRYPNDRSVLEMLRSALKDEKITADYYRKLADRIQDDHDEQILLNISLDEIKHGKLLSEIYEKITGEQFLEITVDEKMPAGSLGEEFLDSMEDEIGDYLFYRDLYLAMFQPEMRDILFEIMTDEQCHCQWLSYLAGKYSR